MSEVKEDRTDAQTWIEWVGSTYDGQNEVSHGDHKTHVLLAAIADALEKSNIFKEAEFNRINLRLGFEKAVSSPSFKKLIENQTKFDYYAALHMGLDVEALFGKEFCEMMKEKKE